jgi:ComF family protein
VLAPHDDPLACAECAGLVRRLAPPFCAVCGAPFATGAGGHLCPACERKQPAFDHLRGVVAYDRPVADAIIRFKYGRDTTLARALARVLWSTRHLGIAWTGYDAILPVPLHPDRLRTRRFNQALLLLWSLPQRGLPVRAQWLVRTRATAPQVSLPDDHRHTNVRAAFAVAPGVVLKGLRLLLVDDVASTGATLHECAKVCKKAGAREVDAAVVARSVLC